MDAFSYTKYEMLSTQAKVCPSTGLRAVTGGPGMDTIGPKKSLVDQTYQILLDAICTGELVPGERLTQDQIAARLNVSRQPVNSAISILKANRFVEDTGRRGVVVSALDPDLLRSILEFRGVIEPFAVRLAGERLPPDAAAESGAALRRGWHAVAAGEARALLQADADFHEMLYRWTGNPVIQNTMRLNWHHIRRTMAEAVRDPDSARQVWDDHDAIIAALLSGRVDSAVDRMRQHVGASRYRLPPGFRGAVSG